MAVFLSIILGFLPAFLYAAFVYWLDRYEKEPKVLLGGVFIWGVIIASGGAFIINTLLGFGVYLFTGSEGAADLTTGSLIAPIIEESLKGLAVLLVFLVARNEFDSVIDGIVYAAITALGFAATENAYYIYTYGYAENGMAGLWQVAFVRVILVGWQHPFYTSFIGIGLAAARLNNSGCVRLFAPITGWLAAVTAHALHNTIASFANNGAGVVFGTFLDWSGWLIMLIFIIYMLRREHQLILKYLQDEVERGTLTLAQYQIASSGWGRALAGLKATPQSRRATQLFYDLCANLAFKKYQLARVGQEEGTAQVILSLRSRLQQLSATLV